jgi:hypothetical protein
MNIFLYGERMKKIMPEKEEANKKAIQINNFGTLS